MAVASEEEKGCSVYQNSNRQMQTERQQNSGEFEELLEAIQSSKKVLDSCTEEREQKFQDSTRNYLNYLRKENRLLEANIRHCNFRNQQFLGEVRKTQERGFANSKRLITVMSRTNHEKEALQRYIDSLDDHQPLDRSRDISRLSEQRAADLQKYRDILAEFQHKLG